MKEWPGQSIKEVSVTVPPPESRATVSGARSTHERLSEVCENTTMNLVRGIGSNCGVNHHYLSAHTSNHALNRGMISDRDTWTNSSKRPVCFL